jgi:hypothetical protein
MNASSDPALPIVDPPNLNDLPADFSGHVIDFFEESHRLLTAAALVGLILGFGEQRNLMPSSALRSNDSRGQISPGPTDRRASHLWVDGNTDEWTRRRLSHDYSGSREAKGGATRAVNRRSARSRTNRTAREQHHRGQACPQIGTVETRLGVSPMRV